MTKMRNFDFENGKHWPMLTSDFGTGTLISSSPMRGHDRQNPVSNSDVANLNSVVPNCCFIRTEFKRAQQNLRLQDRI